MNENQTIPIFERYVSVFGNVHDTEPKEMKLSEFLALGERYQEQIFRLRDCTNKDERSYYKKQLPMMTTSGVFRGGRKADCLAGYSGLICIDIDEADNTEVSDFDKLKENVLCNIKEVAYAARSVGGRGFYAIIPLKYPERHKQQFKQLQQDFASLGITIDQACSDVCRLRCVSYDEAPYINQQAEQYCGLYVEKPAPVPRREFHRCMNDVDNTDEKAFLACKYAVQHHIDMTRSYDDWMKIGFALASLGEFGRDLFHMVSSVNEKYKPAETDRKFTELLRDGNRIGIGTFFHYCQRFGVRCDGSR